MPHLIAAVALPDFADVRAATDLAERAGFDAVLLSPGREPTTVLGALAAVTSRVGLIATVSPRDTEPYHLARVLASLDHLSGGRAGWHIPDTDDRTPEFHEVVTALWDSFDDDAFVHDQESGVYFRPESLHALGHRGPHLSVAGPLNIARPPQGHPVVLLPDGSVADAPDRVFRPLDPREDVVAQIRDGAGDHLLPVSDLARLSDFVRDVVPLLHAESLLRDDYTTTTLREHLGVPRPASRYARATRS